MGPTESHCIQQFQAHTISCSLMVLSHGALINTYYAAITETLVCFVVWFNPAYL